MKTRRSCKGRQGLAFAMSFVLLLSMAGIPPAQAGAGEVYGERVLFDFGTGGLPYGVRAAGNLRIGGEPVYAGASSSLQWNVSTHRLRMTFENANAGDGAHWSGYEHFHLRFYTAAAGARFTVVISTMNANGGYGDYFVPGNITVEKSGWQTFILPIGSISPGILAQGVKILEVACDGWGMTPDTQSTMYFDSIWLSKGPVFDYSAQVGNSLDYLYPRSVVGTALAAMENAFAVYAGSAQVVGRGGGVSPLGGALSAKAIDGTVFVPASFFTGFLGTSPPQSGYKTPPQTIDGVLYLPAAETAERLGKKAVADGDLVVVGADDAISLFRRPRGLGVNEYRDIIAYLACYRAKDIGELGEAAFRQFKDNWVKSVAGSPQANDLGNPRIAAAVQTVTSSGQAAWNALIKTPGSRELFTNITTTASAHMSTTYLQLFNMARAWATYGSTLYRNSGLKDDILFGLQWMYENRYGEAERNGTGWRDPNAYNWWDWQIGSPIRLIPILMMMEEHLGGEQIGNYLALFDKLVPAPRDVGSNRIELGLLVIGSAALTGDTARALRAQAAMEETLLFADNHRRTDDRIYGSRAQPRGQGFYTDGSYVYHILQAMNGAYGLEHFATLVKYLRLVQGTPLALSTPQAGNASQFFSDAFDPLTYQGQMFRMVLGREENGAAKGQALVKSMIHFLNVAGEDDRAKVQSVIKEYVQSNPNINFYSGLELDAVAALSSVMADGGTVPRSGLRTNRVYYNMDKAVHQRGGWAAGISMSSSRMFNYQSINGQNLKGWYLGDGMTEYYVKWDYTHGSAAYWRDVDYYRLPGTTVDAQTRRAVSIAGGNEYLSGKDFVGGVSLNQTYGSAAMWLESYHNLADFGADAGSYGGKAPAHTSDLTAKKGYFLFDDEMVCLGSAVTATDNNSAPVLTIVENRMAKATTALPGGGRIGTDAFTVDGSRVSLSTSDLELTSPVWAHLEGAAGYYFPPNPGSGAAWARWAAGESTSFLQLWFAHGVNPQNGSYAYVLLPGKTVAETRAYAENPAVSVLANTPSLQAVRHEGLGITSMVFWEAGSFEGVTADRPMMVMLQKDAAGVRIAVSDPTQKLTEGTVTLSSRLLMDEADDQIAVTTGQGSTQIKLDFTGSQGRSMEATLRRGLVKGAARLTDGAGAPVEEEAVAGADALNVSCPVYNHTGTDAGATLFLAQYDGAGALVSLHRSEGGPLPPGRETILRITGAPVHPKAARARVFVWDGALAPVPDQE